MCLEGGCGVCVVNIAGLKSADGSPRSMAVNSVCFYWFFFFSIESHKDDQLRQFNRNVNISDNL